MYMYLYAAGKSTEEVSFRTLAGCPHNSTAYPLGTFNIGCESACECKVGHPTLAFNFLRRLYKDDGANKLRPNQTWPTFVDRGGSIES